MKVVIKRAQANFLFKLYDKLSIAEFETIKDTITHTKDRKKIVGLVEENQEIENTIKKKYNLSEKSTDKDLVLPNQEFIKLMSEEEELDLSPISRTVVEQIKMTPIEISLLHELGICVFDELNNEKEST